MSHFFFPAKISNAVLDATNILCKVNFVLDTILCLKLKVDTILTSLSTLKKVLKFPLDPQTDFEWSRKKKFLQINCLILSISIKGSFRNEAEKLKSELL
eukprot:UN21497